MTTHNDFSAQIDALRSMTVEAYEGVIDPLIEALEAASLLDQYEETLLEIDNSFDKDFYQQLDEMMDILGHTHQEKLTTINDVKTAISIHEPSIK